MVGGYSSARCNGLVAVERRALGYGAWNASEIVRFDRVVR
jgi:hypothetical protein